MSIGMMMRRVLIASGSSIVSGTPLGSLFADHDTTDSGRAALLSLEASSNGVARCLDGISGGSLAADSGVLAGLLANEFLTLVGLLDGNGDENLLDLTLMLHFSVGLGGFVGVGVV